MVDVMTYSIFKYNQTRAIYEHLQLLFMLLSYVQKEHYSQETKMDAQIADGDTWKSFVLDSMDISP